MTKFSYAHFHKIPEKLFMSSKIDVFMENFAKTLKKVIFCRHFIENEPFLSKIKKKPHSRVFWSLKEKVDFRPKNSRSSEYDNRKTDFDKKWIFQRKMLIFLISEINWIWAISSSKIGHYIHKLLRYDDKRSKFEFKWKFFVKKC